MTREALIAYYRDVLGWSDREARAMADELYAPAQDPALCEL